MPEQLNFAVTFEILLSLFQENLPALSQTVEAQYSKRFSPFHEWLDLRVALVQRYQHATNRYAKKKIQSENRIKLCKTLYFTYVLGHYVR